MRLHNYLNEEIQPTEEMWNFFNERTKKHIDRVAKNLKKIAIEREDLTPKELDEIHKRIFSHDNSKYSKEEKIPYVWLSWWHKKKNEGETFKYPEGIEEKVRKATKHHILVNKHHPEAHNSPKDMIRVDLIEMIADWTAMSQELNNSLKEWADKNVNKKWMFTKEQTKFIYDIVRIFE